MTKTGQKQALFVEAFIQNGGNGREAAIAAGYKAGRAADKAAERMSHNVAVQATIKKRKAEVLAQAQEKTGLTAQEIIDSLARDIRFDPAKLKHPDGRMKDVTEMDEDTRRALRGIEVEEISVGKGEERTVIGQTTKVKFPDITPAREQGMKHFGLYEQDNKQKPPTVVHMPGAPAPKFKPLRARTA